jgi:hypothetical protein
MLVAAEIAFNRGTMAPDDRDALAALIAKLGPLPAVADVPVAEALEAIAHDKKVVAGQLHYVLPRGLGACEVVADVTKEEIAVALRSIGLKSSLISYPRLRPPGSRHALSRAAARLRSRSSLVTRSLKPVSRVAVSEIPSSVVTRSGALSVSRAASASRSAAVRGASYCLGLAQDLLDLHLFHFGRRAAHDLGRVPDRSNCVRVTARSRLSTALRTTGWWRGRSVSPSARMTARSCSSAARARSRPAVVRSYRRGGERTKRPQIAGIQIGEAAQDRDIAGPIAQRDRDQEDRRPMQISRNRRAATARFCWSPPPA